jgi:L-ectoine synthase
MIIRRLAEIVDTASDVHAGTWNSRRLLLAKDGMGFSMHDTLIHAGTETYMWYKHHLEAVYCIEGDGEIEDLGTGAVHPLGPGVLYALDGNEKHFLRARTQLRMICVFNPPVTGNEVHDESGAYPIDRESEVNGSAEDSAPEASLETTEA